MSPTFVDTPTSLVAFLDSLPDCEGQPPSLYIDLEGNSLGRHGTLSIITILVQPLETTYLIDVTTLGKETFTIKGHGGLTLKTILESPNIIKVFFDVRNDSDALYSLYGIHLKAVEDIQLFEFASRTYDKRYVNGLAKCIERHLQLPFAEQQQWQRGKDQGRRLFDPKLGGSYAVFDKRPLTKAMMEYCAQDVVHMPRLRELYLNKLCDAWYVKIKAETEARIRLSQTKTYDGKGDWKKFGPSAWALWGPSAQEMNVKTMFQSAPSKAMAGPSNGKVNSTVKASSLPLAKPQSFRHFEYDDDPFDEYDSNDYDSPYDYYDDSNDFEDFTNKYSP
ncbi:hypothetical protein PRZ48_005878 [Zasmidium cellare]|uniref:3'-5' exonuclease domain-containing protein n=1 Tax=Zasmidium cellare TaxID=395010 RepID=A0ABR0EMU8_ZASCE|nr:hypothetical protein PRZ48_005878 [Zasmidium cellare]